MLSALHRMTASGLYRLDKMRLGERSVLSYLRQFERTQYLPIDELRQLQLARLKSIVQHAQSNCSFYERRFAEYGVDASSLSDQSSLADFPILEKRHIQRHRQEIAAADWPVEDRLENRTGGSTGEPLELYVDRQRKCSREAATLRHNRWAGWRTGDKIAHIWGAAFDLRSDGLKHRLRNLLVDRSIYFNTGRITEQKILAFHQALKRFRPRIIHAYAKSAALVARYLKSQGLPAYGPEAVVTSAETLMDEDRQVIEEVFECPVFNRYGCREVSVVASECEQHDGMHIMSEGIHVEVVKHDTPAAPGDSGSILVTDLLNYAMPLIRYRIGDVGALKDTTCSCGRTLPLLDRIDGRITDFLVGTDGRLVSGPFLSLYLIGQRPTLGQAQICQEKAGEILLRVTAAPTDADVEFIRHTCTESLGPGAKVEFEVVDEITRNRSGKLLLSKSTATTDFVELGPAAEGADA